MAHATIRVQFGNPDAASAANAHLSAEIDSRNDGLNGGKTSFAPGESVYILVYKTNNVSITQAASSAGSITQSGSATVEIEEDVMFEDTDTGNLGRPVTGGIAGTVWMGRSLGSLSVQADKTTVKASQKGIAVARVKYTTHALVYKLSSPTSLNGLEDFSILAVIQGEVKA
ncbi:MAG: hypothetical protein ACOZAP_04500 [Pseudomonadota bacterium]